MKKKFGLHRLTHALFASLILTGPALLSESELTVKGRVLYSFTEPHALLQTKHFVARIILAKLSKQQRLELEKTGAEISVSLPRDSIDLVWAVSPNANEPIVVEGPKRPNTLKEVKDAKNFVQLQGKILTAFGKSDRLIQVGSYIYRIDYDQVPADSKKLFAADQEFISIVLPAKAIIFAWKLNPETIKDRAPSNINEQKVESLNGELMITGRAIASFSEPHALIQSAGKIYQLRKKQLPASELEKVNRIGNEVTVKVPTRAVEYYWPSEP